MDKLPEEVNVLGLVYKVEYVESPSDVDIYKRESLWGQCDYWTRTIRIYVGSNRPLEDIWQTLWHEILHAIGERLHIEVLQGDRKNVVDLTATGIIDVLIRNGWMKL